MSTSPFQTEMKDFLKSREKNSTSLFHRNMNPEKTVKIIKSHQWKKLPYRKQNWGVWLHRMSPYVGKMKPAIAHWLIKSSTTKNQVILDPFCGVGTVPLEADLMNRKAVGIDLNPYAATISKAKFDRHPVEYHIKWLESARTTLNLDSVDISNVSPFIKQYFHEDTLRQLYALRGLILSNGRTFLLGCLLGILHGHRPGHLSARTSLVIPFIPKTKPPYREVIPRLLAKVKRMYRDPIPLKTNSVISREDAKNLPLRESSIDVIISSPPYYDTLDYVQDNRLRLAFLGYDEEDRDRMKSELMQNRESYLTEMEAVGRKLNRILKPKGLCIFVLGDLTSGKTIVNTANEVSKTYANLGFKTLAIINDRMPHNKALPSKYKRKKLDRILVMINEL